MAFTDSPTTHPERDPTSTSTRHAAVRRPDRARCARSCRRSRPSKAPASSSTGPSRSAISTRSTRSCCSTTWARSTTRPGEAVGAPDHPHRGFETVSYILEGELEHEDSAGHHGVIGPGDVQWMTAGAGVVHSEMPSRRMQTEGGRVEGFQIWVNLPAAEKMTDPRYQEVPKARIPHVELDDGRAVVRLIAGRAHGVEGAVETTSPILYAHVTVQPGGQVDLPAAAGDERHGLRDPRLRRGRRRRSTGAPVRAGGARPRRRRRCTSPPATDEPFDVLVLAGEPLREPIARYGPFVMNTRQQIVDAFEDYQAGRLGSITR